VLKTISFIKGAPLFFISLTRFDDFCKALQNNVTTKQNSVKAE
jgi:hypothetical protein